MTIRQSAITIIGGGVVGLSVAIGLLRKGHKVTVLDASDGEFSASKGNFGLVWLQGKGAQYDPYAHLSCDAVANWPDFAKLVQELSGTNLCLDQSGGFEFFTDVAEFNDFCSDLEQQQGILGNRFNYEAINGDDLRRTYPEIGPDVVGATHSPLDGHVNPLRLHEALRQSVSVLGGDIISGAHVSDVIDAVDGFEIQLTNGQKHGAERVVVAAGLGSSNLAKKLGFRTQVRPQRGELLITEKLSQKLPFLSSTIRQTNEGGLQIGGTKADAGFDDSETLDVMAGLANHAVSVFPALRDLRVIRAWGALRVMSPDGYPVYAQSTVHPNAFLVTCHSGITLAPFHANALVNWIDETPDAPNLEAFDETRFSISSAA